PIVVQYNKRDLDDILSESELDRSFKFRDGIQSYPSVATEGQGVFEAFVEATSMLVERKIALYGLGRGRAKPHEVAEGVRQKLYAICDDVRRARAVVPVADLPQTRVALGDPAAATPLAKPPAKPGKAKPATSADDAQLESLELPEPAAPSAAT